VKLMSFVELMNLTNGGKRTRRGSMIIFIYMRIIIMMD